jgi:hypothetical protein
MASGEGDKSPGEDKAHEGRCFPSVQVLVGNKDVCREPGPEVEASANHKRVAARESVYDSADGKVPEGHNPMDVTGMKQGR